MFIFPLAVIFLTKNHKHFANIFLRIFKQILEIFKISQVFVWFFFILQGETSNFNFINLLFRNGKYFHTEFRTSCFTSPSQVLPGDSARVASLPPHHFCAKKNQCVMSKGLILLPQNLAMLQTNCYVSRGQQSVDIVLRQRDYSAAITACFCPPASFPADILTCLRHPVVYNIPLVSPWLFAALSKYACRLTYTLKRCLSITKWY